MIMEDQKDSQLIEKYINGDEQSLAVLIKRHLPLTYGICLRYLQNETDAEDATQEIFVKVWKYIKRFDHNKSFPAWVSEIAKNTCLDILKQKKVIPFSTFESADGNNLLTNTLVDSGLLPYELAEQSMNSRWVQAAILKLAPIYQKVLRLYYGDGLNFREISDTLEEPLHTVKSRHRRAMILLKKLLSDI